jgi:hypothetical protein
MQCWKVPKQQQDEETLKEEVQRDLVDPLIASLEK